MVFSLACFLINIDDNRVADGHQLEKLKYFIELLRAAILQLIQEFLFCSVYFASDRTLLVLHDVAGERAGLIRKDEFDLAHFFDEVRVATEGEAGFRVVDVHIRGDYVRLAHLDHFEDNVERDRDQM